MHLHIYMMLDVIFISVKLATTLALPDHSNSRPFDTNAPRQEARGTSAGSLFVVIIGSLADLPLEALDVIEKHRHQLPLKQPPKHECSLRLE